MMRDASPVALTPAVAISANGTSQPVTGLLGLVDILAQLNLSAGPTGGAPTLDVYLQTSVDGGTTWLDIAHTQFTTATLSRFIQIAGDSAGATSIGAASDAALAGETVKQGPWGDRLRLKWVFAAGGSTGSYTLKGDAFLK